jgi:acetoacetyl-CoA synthetase
MSEPSETLWTPSVERTGNSQIQAFANEASRRTGLDLSNYSALHGWSVRELDAFWTLVWEMCEVVGDRGERPSVLGSQLTQSQFFPDARLNFAENCLRRRDDEVAIVFISESGKRRELSFADLYARVAKLAEWLRGRGVRAGDRVAACLPNLPDTIVAMLATSSLGGIWSSCSPDFGIDGVLDRFSQIEPKIIFCVDYYEYNGKRIETLTRVPEILAALPGVEACVIVPYAGRSSDHAREMAEIARPSPFSSASSSPSSKVDGGSAELFHLDGIIDESVDGSTEDRAVPDLVFERLAIDHPLYILFSSGTTGKPKCIVHGAGGTLLQHLKEHRLHVDLRQDDRLFYFTTCGWMMWNWLATGLASGARLILYDGSPFHPDARRLWKLAADEEVNVFGVSAKFIDSSAKAGVMPGSEFDLSNIRTILSTGSPLGEESFDYVYREVAEDVHLASISGGTDIVSCFVLGSPTLPVRRGEIQCAGLGMQVEVFDDDANPIVGTPGELVCTKPFPSMPVQFWNDPDGARYHAAYFERFENVWCHGDWCIETDSGGFVILGRSDAVLNPGGVRIGTAEIYSQVESFDEILESIAIGQAWEGDVRVVLFVKMTEGAIFDEALQARLRSSIRVKASPRHVPARILEVRDIPRTRSGKITELAVRDIVAGREVKNVEALANPEALEFFRNREELES